MVTTKKAIYFILLSSLFAGTGQLLWKRSSLDLTLNILSWINPYLIMGILFFIIATFLMTYALREGEVSVLFPFLSLSYIWVTIVSTLLFKEETMNFNKAFSILLVVIGVSLIGLGGKRTNAH